eukprot:gb/GEZJ01002217.1/.p1 GENE.gb/GEZJ01002217.1/~~gb/GEZJ01002217.1/.p1  ORF type:complete len:366 (-),score=42.41 gb/GEZJ01002217.1/:62-1159(-)
MSNLDLLIQASVLVESKKLHSMDKFEALHGELNASVEARMSTWAAISDLLSSAQCTLHYLKQLKQRKEVHFKMHECEKEFSCILSSVLQLYNQERKLLHAVKRQIIDVFAGKNGLAQSCAKRGGDERRFESAEAVEVTTAEGLVFPSDVGRAGEAVRATQAVRATPAVWETQAVWTTEAVRGTEAVEAEEIEAEAMKEGAMEAGSMEAGSMKAEAIQPQGVEAEAIQPEAMEAEAVRGVKVEDTGAVQGVEANDKLCIEPVLAPKDRRSFSPPGQKNMATQTMLKKAFCVTGDRGSGGPDASQAVRERSEGGAHGDETRRMERKTGLKRGEADVGENGIEARGGGCGRWRGATGGGKQRGQPRGS